MPQIILIPAPEPPAQPEKEFDFEDWKKKYNKRYSSKIEEKFRKKNFYENYGDIKKVNANFNSGKSSIKLAPNIFADLKAPEFLSLHTGLKQVESSAVSYQKLNPTNVFKSSESLKSNIPESFDWRDRGAVTSVKDQGKTSKKIT